MRASSRVGASCRTRRGPYLVDQPPSLFLFDILSSRYLSECKAAAACPGWCDATIELCIAIDCSKGRAKKCGLLRRRPPARLFRTRRLLHELVRIEPVVAFQLG